MKFLNINKAFALFGFVLILSVYSCTNDDVFEVGEDETVTFSDFGVDYGTKGAIISVSDISPTFYNLFESATTNVGFTVGSQGEDVSAAKMWVSRNGGDAVKFADISSLPAKFDIPLSEVASTLGISVDDFMGGDVISFTFSDVTTAGGSFPSGFAFNVDASCPSTIAEGQYIAKSTGQSTDDCCPSPVDVETVVTLTSQGSGLYTISDWSAGMYLAWYGPDGGNYGITADTDLTGTLKDVCNTISGTNAEPFGTDVITAGTYDPATGVITMSWKNGYDDSSNVVLTPM